MAPPKIDSSIRVGMPTANDELQTLGPAKNARIQPGKPTETNFIQKGGGFIDNGEARGAMIKLVKNPPAEHGHATPPSAEQKAWDDYNKAKSEWDTKKSAFDNASKGIESADKGIAKIDEQVKNLHILFTSGQLQGDKVLTWKELEWLHKNGTDEQKTAAKWMMDNKADFYDSMAKGTTLLDVDGNPNFNGEPVGVGLTLQSFVDKRKEMLGYRAQAVAAKPAAVADPGPPPTPPVKPATTENSSVGQNPPAGASPTPGSGASPTPPPGAETTPKPAGKSATENYDKIGAFSSKATTSEGRMADGLDFLQRGSQALQEDLLNASTENPPNQAKIALIQNKLQQVQNALTAVMQMMKQFQEMMSNMSKMYSEMAMSAIRNMR